MIWLLIVIPSITSMDEGQRKFGGVSCFGLAEDLAIDLFEDELGSLSDPGGRNPCPELPLRPLRSLNLDYYLQDLKAFC